ncbi:MAG: hypothetical protein ACKO8O_14020 [Betaproteobacteria bacterium]
MRSTRRAALVLGVVLPFGSQAEIFQDSRGNTWEISGFVKVEATRSAQAPKQIPEAASLYQYDERNAFIKPPANPVLGNRSSSLALQQLSLGYKHETEGAVTFEARSSYRWRSTAALGEWFTESDVSYRRGKGLSDRDWFEKFIGVSRPDLGFVRYGTQLSRTWARSDSFSYPIGLANQWAGSGAGFSVVPEALRLTSKPFEDGIGKLTFEVTVGRDRLNTDDINQNRMTQSGIAYQPGATEPRLVELFLQYSRERHLIEFTLQNVAGARQSSFGKAPLVGWIGDPDQVSIGGTAVPRRAGRPGQSAAILQGNYWPNPQNMLTYGARHNRWSGSAASCAYDGVKCLFGIDPGFNYGNSSSDYTGYRVSNYDLMLGWSHYRGLFTYTAGGVYYGRGSSDNPIEWGQSNSGLSLNFGLYRKLPELHKGASVYGGIGWSRVSRLGPAPVSMPANQFLGFNSHYDRSGSAATVGFNLVF